MDNPFRRWFGLSPAADPWSDAARWAEGEGHRFARSSDGSGFVIEPIDPGAVTPVWRLEWGAAQRHYIDGGELRIRGEVGRGGKLQMLILTRSLRALLEQQVFDEFTEGNQTRIDDRTPEEMRWLVLHPKLPRAALGPAGELYAVSASLPTAAPLWLEGALSTALLAAPGWLAPSQPLVITVQRERLSLRCGQPRPEPAAMKAALALFGIALAAARRVGDEVAQGRVGSQLPSSWDAPGALPPTERTPG